MSYRRRRLAGKRVIVTGASSGVGRAVALELASRGARVLATARRGDRLEELCRSAAPAAIEPLAGDICGSPTRLGGRSGGVFHVEQKPAGLA